MIDECDKEIEKQLIVQIASKNEGVIPEIPLVGKKNSIRIKYPLTLPDISK